MQEEQASLVQRRLVERLWPQGTLVVQVQGQLVPRVRVLAQQLRLVLH